MKLQVKMDLLLIYYLQRKALVIVMTGFSVAD